jgi:hypothetical protein
LFQDYPLRTAVCQRRNGDGGGGMDEGGVDDVLKKYLKIIAGDSFLFPIFALGK